MKTLSLTARLGPVLLLGLVPLTVQAQYVGARRCRPCHLPQGKSWEQSRMANAFELLKPGVAAEVKRSRNVDPNKDYTHDPNCLPCHVTGYEQPGGFVSLEKTPQLVGVQCEVCHGAGGGYLKPNLMSLQNKAYKRADLMTAGLLTSSPEACKTCHNQKSPFYKPFVYEEHLKKGIHAHEPLKNKHD